MKERIQKQRKLACQVVQVLQELGFFAVVALLFGKPQTACESKILKLREGHANEVPCIGGGVPSIQAENNETFLICTCPTKSGESK